MSDALPWILGFGMTVPPGLIFVRRWLLTRRHPRELGIVPVAEEWLDVYIDNRRTGGQWVRVAAYDEFIVVAHLRFLVDEYRVIRTAMQRPGPFGTVHFRFQLRNRWVTLVLNADSSALRLLEQRLDVKRASWSP